MQNPPAEPVSAIKDSETKLFKLNSGGNWDDEGTGKTSITRGPTDALSITFKMHPKPTLQYSQNDSDSQISNMEQEYLFEDISSYSIESNSILVFISREKRFALSFKDPDPQFVSFFKDSIKSSEQEMVEEVSVGTVLNYMTKDDSFIGDMKTTFQKSEKQGDTQKIVDMFVIFKKFLNDCNDDFIKVMFTDDNVEFLFSVLEYANTGNNRVQYREYIKDIKYQNLLGLPPNILKAVKLIIYLSEFKDLVSLMIQPSLEHTITFMIYENTGVIVNYFLSREETLVQFLEDLSQNIKKRVKLLIELLNLLSSVSSQNKNKIIKILLNNKKINLFYKLTQCLSDDDIRKELSVHVDSETLGTHVRGRVTQFEDILKIFSTISSIQPLMFEEFIIQSLQDRTQPGSDFCAAMVFGYTQGNINLKSVILELLSNIFSPQTAYKHHKITDSQGNQTESKEIFLLLDRNIISPICKQLFKSNQSFQGEELMIEWISKLFFSYPIIMRRVIIESGIIKKALERSQKQRILLLLILKILKSMLQIKDHYTIRYLKFSKVIDVLQVAYSKNKGKINLIGSLFKCIRNEIQTLHYQGKSLKDLERIFESEEIVAE